MTSRDEERENLRRELQRARDQLAELLASQRATPTPTATTPPSPPPPSPPPPLTPVKSVVDATTSRPASHISLSDCDASSVAEPTDQVLTDAASNLHSTSPSAVQKSSYYPFALTNEVSFIETQK